MNRMENKKKLLFYFLVDSNRCSFGLSCNFLLLIDGVSYCVMLFFLAIKYYFSHMRVFVFVERWVCLLADILWTGFPSQSGYRGQLAQINWIKITNISIWKEIAWPPYSHTNNTHWHTLYRSVAYKLSVFFFLLFILHHTLAYVWYYNDISKRHDRINTQKTHKHNRIDYSAIAFSSIIATNRFVSICERRIAM